MTNVSISEGWKVEYRDSEEPKQFNWFSWQEAQRFAKEVAATSIVFFATGIFERPGGLPEHKTVYEETLTSEEFAEVSAEWIEERRKRIKAEVERQN